MSTDLSEFSVTPTTVTLYPGDTSAVFYCVADPFVIVWEINGMIYRLDELFTGDLSGHNVSGSNITVSNPVHGTKYVCVIPRTPPTPSVLSDPAFLYIVGKYNSIDDGQPFVLAIIFITGISVVTGLIAEHFLYCSLFF